MGGWVFIFFVSLKKSNNQICIVFQGIQELEKKLTFAKKDGYGYLTFCPTNLGTTCRASVHIRIPKLSKLPEFKEFCEKLNLQPRGRFDNLTDDTYLYLNMEAHIYIDWSIFFCCHGYLNLTLQTKN